VTVSLLPAALFLAAAAAVDPVATRNRLEAQRLFDEGLNALSRERYEKAEEAFRGALRLDPSLFLAHYGLGQTYMATRQFEDAARQYGRCIESFREAAAEDRSQQLELAQGREDRIRDLKERIREIERSLAGSLSATRTRAARSRIGSIEAAIASLEALRGDRSGPLDPPAEFFLAKGSACFRAGQLALAERDYREAVRLKPRYGEAHNNLAVICMMKGELEAAFSHVQLAEKAGFKVSPELKKDLQERKTAAK
jgi:Flp pilus assembly protein TadD